MIPRSGRKLSSWWTTGRREVRMSPLSLPSRSSLPFSPRSSAWTGSASRKYSTCSASSRQTLSPWWVWLAAAVTPGCLSSLTRVSPTWSRRVTRHIRSDSKNNNSFVDSNTFNRSLFEQKDTSRLGNNWPLDTHTFCSQHGEYRQSCEQSGCLTVPAWDAPSLRGRIWEPSPHISNANVKVSSTRE